MTVNNGRRIPVALPDYQGIAGFVDRGELASLAYMPDAKARKKTPPIDMHIPIDDTAWFVAHVADSPYVRGARVVTLRKGQ